MWRGTAEPVVLQLGGRTVPSDAALQQGKTRGCPWLHGLRLQLPGKQGGAGGVDGRAAEGLTSASHSVVTAGGSGWHEVLQSRAGAGAAPRVVRVGFMY